MSDVCKHGSLRRSCEICERDDFIKEQEDALWAEITRLRAENQKLAEYVRRLWAAEIFDCSPDPQEIGEELGICERRRPEPGSIEAEEWGEDEELYYLCRWVLAAAGEVKDE